MPETMPALFFTGDGGSELRDVAVPSPGPGEARIRLTRAAICGTDVHKRARPAARQPRKPDGSPVISGHEPVGRIEALGAGVSGFSRGDRVLVAGVVGCGHCGPCRRGHNTRCAAGPGGLHGSHDGSNAPFMVIPSTNLIAIPDALSWDGAVVLTCAGGTAITALTDTHASPEDRVAVLGLGPVGLCAALLAEAQGAAVIGFDTRPGRRARARALGLTIADDEDMVAAARAFGDGRGCDVVIECAGGSVAREAALAMAARGGRIALAGLGGADAAPVIERAIAAGLSLHGTAATPIALFPGLLARAARSGGLFERLITHHVPLVEVPAAIDLMASGDCGKIVVTLEGEA